MKTTTSIPLIIATVLVLGTVGAVATAQDNQKETINELLMLQDSSDQAEHPKRHDKGRQGNHKMAHGQRHGMPGQPGSDLMRKLLRNVDANADGAVTQEEIDSFKTAQLSGADVDTDGALNIEEFDTIYRALTRSRMVDMFQNFDEDGDGNISPAELDERIGQVVERMDRNDDGALSREDGQRRAGK